MLSVTAIFFFSHFTSLVASKELKMKQWEKPEKKTQQHLKSEGGEKDLVAVPMAGSIKKKKKKKQ